MIRWSGRSRITAGGFRCVHAAESRATARWSGPLACYVGSYATFLRRASPRMAKWQARGPLHRTAPLTEHHPDHGRGSDQQDQGDRADDAERKLTRLDCRGLGLISLTGGREAAD